jgi:L-amino acid N-acyltransferase YncA
MIRELKREEINEIALLYENSISRKFKQSGKKPVDLKNYEKVLRKGFQKKHMFVFIEDHQGINGFLWFDRKDRQLILEELMVTDKNKGYGKQLIQFMVDFAKKENIKKISLDVNLSDKGEIKFFEKFGFKEKAIEMSLDIPKE